MCGDDTINDDDDDNDGDGNKVQLFDIVDIVIIKKIYKWRHEG